MTPPGMFDSPFVRRVAITMHRYDMPFEHLDWSVGRDFARIRGYSPLGRVPTLVLDDGEVLTESAAILDFLDGQVGPQRALLPASGAERRRALQLMALAERDRACASRGGGAWLVGSRMTQADITTTCMVTFVAESVGVTAGAAPCPALRALVARCEALPVFREFHAPAFMPVP